MKQWILRALPGKARAAAADPALGAAPFHMPPNDQEARLKFSPDRDRAQSGYDCEYAIPGDGLFPNRVLCIRRKPQRPHP